MKDIFPSLVTVYTGTDRIRIEMVKTLLAAEGIFCQIEGERLTGLMGIQPDILGISEIKLQVRGSDAGRAREILEKEIEGYGNYTKSKEE
ncbi:hypothetical protein GF359_10255 [candidate division WOR-3 bacterium]|uniref:DUF2007 domain-containing protein n=1 Tax=candidate division WOR-3 bacterium TaxID=2052148 RepID=A0A9D5KBB7_UNCW3|nr:hypothetical protein [candidate division WOR-3 bacterium]MBD3365582.1 hypothetical protein [candidate division WOR-3 bacterium]